MKKPEKRKTPKLVSKKQPKPAISREQAEVLLADLLKRFDLKVEPLEEINKRLKSSDHLCWQGSAINAGSA